MILYFLGERGQCILSTPPKILFCDLRLDPGESKSCECLPTLALDCFLKHLEGGFLWLPSASLTTPSQPDSYSEVLPIEGPPSFRGQSVKYVYKLTIGCQRVNSPITLLRVPLRVLVLTGKRGFLVGRAVKKLRHSGNHLWRDCERSLQEAFCF